MVTRFIALSLFTQVRCKFIWQGSRETLRDLSRIACPYKKESLYRHFRPQCRYEPMPRVSHANDNVPSLSVRLSFHIPRLKFSGLSIARSYCTWGRYPRNIVPQSLQWTEIYTNCHSVPRRLSPWNVCLSTERRSKSTETKLLATRCLTVETHNSENAENDRSRRQRNNRYCKNRIDICVFISSSPNRRTIAVSWVTSYVRVSVLSYFFHPPSLFKCKFYDLYPPPRWTQLRDCFGSFISACSTINN